MKIDFVSDVSCPWCVIGLKSLEKAIDRLGPEFSYTLQFQPFELNPRMADEGQDLEEHLQQKYGSTPAQGAAVREAIRKRGAELGFTFDLQARSRIYNTFDCHRLLHWAGTQSASAQHDLKLALFSAYFSEGKKPSDHGLMLEKVVALGLDVAEAQAVLSSDRYAAEVREQEDFYHAQGIHSVPSIIINDMHLIQGGQEPEVFEQLLRQVASASDLPSQVPREG
ncbi:DsbA family oxidoreductase [Paucibacter sp. APW11]|uniref:DsbA family oxidoreductase n=1 Tax=Roseateles aquae TaxID=3077235 RepID=A0ABU3P807_9BURK|nr:DsbA family oxidoreductase [Paucibacter sp. APW11]MDT8997886.1 DsbA family oxidoreductase [Paucibacter sp. APW11]